MFDESALFRKARAYVAKNHDAWYILSAKHGRHTKMKSEW
ncbi:DUF6884 domain-containing protein [Halobellus ordinarius]